MNYRLRDWGVSRQRYWGCPIPVIHCEKSEPYPVNRGLPVLLPNDATFDKPGNPLDRHPTWKHVDCPSCGGKARRETNTMDTFVDSSWYFVRFTAPHADAGRGRRGERAGLLRRPRVPGRASRSSSPAQGFDPGANIDPASTPSTSAQFGRSSDPNSRHARDVYGYLAEIDPGVAPGRVLRQ